jgi:hypothetical protein
LFFREKMNSGKMEVFYGLEGGHGGNFSIFVANNFFKI